MFGPALALYGAAFAVSTPVGGMLMMTIALGLSSCTAVGHSMLQHDIAPAHAGVLFAVGNMVATGACLSCWCGTALLIAPIVHCSAGHCGRFVQWMVVASV